MRAAVSEHPRAVRVLTGLLLAAVVVSVVHYVDNYVNYDAFPVPDSGPVPSRGLVGASWFAFTAAGAAGYLLFRAARRLELACALLLTYSLSGLVGFGHYTAAGMTQAPVWRQAHVVADIALGVAIAAFAVRHWRGARLARA